MKQNLTPLVSVEMKLLEAEVEMMLLEAEDEEIQQGADQEIEGEEEAETNVAEVKLVAVDVVAEVTERGKTTVVRSAKKIIKQAIAQNGRTPTLASMSSTIWQHRRIFVPIA